MLLLSRGHSELQNRSFQQVIEQELDELQEQYQIYPEMDFETFDTTYLASRTSFSHGCHSFLGRGLYGLQLQGWLEAFPRDQILILSMEEMKRSLPVRDLFMTN